MSGNLIFKSVLYIFIYIIYLYIHTSQVLHIPLGERILPFALFDCKLYILGASKMVVAELRGDIQMSKGKEEWGPNNEMFLDPKVSADV